jgi:hypothetical protein
MFDTAESVAQPLYAHSCRQALAWCEAQRVRLRKAKSKLEFKLRVQVSPGQRAWWGCGVCLTGSQWLPRRQTWLGGVDWLASATCSLAAQAEWMPLRLHSTTAPRTADPPCRPFLSSCRNSWN